MRQFALMVMLAVALIFATSQNNQVEASEVYVGSYSDGTAVYVLTETMGLRKVGGGVYYCTVRAGQDYINYDFWSEDDYIKILKVITDMFMMEFHQ